MLQIYVYTGRQRDGKKVSGEMEQLTPDAVAQALFGKGITPVTIKPLQEVQRIKKRQLFKKEKKVETKDLVMLCRQLHTITKGGIPIVAGLQGLLSTLKHPTLRKCLQDVVEQLQMGQELSSALGRHPKIFDELFISMMAVGESSGRLDASFEQLGRYFDRELETRRRIKAAMRYPMFVVGALLVCLTVINITVIPAFADMFAQFGADLPLVTRFLMGMSAAFTDYWWAVFSCVALGVFVFKRWLQSSHGQMVWGEKELELPVVGDIIERSLMSRYARSLSLMMSSGVPLVQALNLCAESIGNRYLRKKITAIRQSVERGESLFFSHNQAGVFPDLVLQMISVGEQTGHVDTLLADAAEFYDREIDYDVEKLSERIQPILMAFMAVFVLILALGIFLPLWDMYSIQGG